MQSNSTESQSEKFSRFIKTLLSTEKIDSDKTLIVPVSKKTKVAILKDQINIDNKKIFCSFISQIPRIRDGLSYKDICFYANLYIREHEAIIIQGVGFALGAWDLVDPFSTEGVFANDLGLLPMNKGLRC